MLTTERHKQTSLGTAGLHIRCPHRLHPRSVSIAVSDLKAYCGQTDLVLFEQLVCAAQTRTGLSSKANHRSQELSYQPTTS